MTGSIIHGDCLEVMRGMDDASVDLIITSPPYNIAAYVKAHENHHSKIRISDGYEGYDDDMPYEDYIAWQREVITECMRVLKETGALFYNHKKSMRNSLLVDHHKILDGFQVRQEIIWDKGASFNQNLTFFAPSHESIYLLAKPKFTRLRKHPIRDVLRLASDRNNPHPASFPVELPYKIINVTDAQVILDPFSGSGSTACAAKALGRHYIGIEKNIKYVEYSTKRLNRITEEPRQHKLGESM